jgi:hypothetical protein
LYLVLLLVSLTLFIMRKCKLPLLREVLNQTAAGRGVTTERYQYRHIKADYGTTTEWSAARGKEIVSIREESAKAASQLIDSGRISLDESEG